MSRAPRDLDLSLATRVDKTVQEPAESAWQRWWLVTGLALLTVFLSG